MRLIVEYIGLIVFALVVLVGGLITLPGIVGMPQTSPGGIVGFVLAFVAIAGGFSWYYFATSHQGSSESPER